MAYHKDAWDYKIVTNDGEILGQERVKGADISCAMIRARIRYPEAEHRLDYLTQVSRVRKNIACRFVVWLFQIERSDRKAGGSSKTPAV